MVCWNVSQKNCFQRVFSGFIKSSVLGSECRFLTLTTNPVSVDGCSDVERLELIQNNFQMLHKRIEREFGCFEYLSVRTSEGFGVIHVIYRGAFIPHSWLVENWNEIHGSFIVDIRKVYSDPKFASRYIVSQYLGGQPDLRYGYSSGWIYKGAYKDWLALKHVCRDWSNCKVNPFDTRKMYAPIDYNELDLRWFNRIKEVVERNFVNV